MDSYILAKAEWRIRRLEAEVLQLKRLEALRCLADENGKFFRKSVLVVIASMAALGLFFVALAQFN